MEQLIYVSVASPSIAGGDVFDIVHKSSSRNPQRGVTGFLLFIDRLFFQYIEGPGAALDELLADLSRDARHHSVTLLARKHCEQRLFPSWKMKRIALSDQANRAADLGVQMRSFGIPASVSHEIEQHLAMRAA